MTTQVSSPTATVNFSKGSFGEYNSNNERLLKKENSGSSTLYLRGMPARRNFSVGGNQYPLYEKQNTQGDGSFDKIYIYGPTGLIAVKRMEGTYFVIKDHLGSTRVVLNGANGEPVNYFDFTPYGNTMRVGGGVGVKYQFTGQEYDDELGLHNFRARLYDSDIGIFYSTDPAGQGFAPFAYAGNNPVIYVDKDGRLFIIDDILIGAAIGALFSGVTYSISAGVQGDWTWSGLGTAVGLGALGGGISGGLGAIGSSLANNTAYNMLTNTIGYAATTVASGSDITFAGVAGMLAGGLVGGAIPGYTASGTSTIGNIFGELVHDSFKGFITGGISGAVSAAISGADINGIMYSFSKGGLQGAKQGAIHAATMISIFGPAFNISEDNYSKTISGLNEMANDMDLVGNGFGNYAPVYRRGGLLDLVQQLFNSRRGFAFGRNLFVPKTSEDHIRYSTLHETMHYYQMIHSGWVYLGWDSFWHGNYGKPGNVEWAADQGAYIYGGFR